MASRYPTHIIMALLVTTGIGWTDRQHEGIIKANCTSVRAFWLDDVRYKHGFYAAHNVHKKEDIFSTKLKVNVDKKGFLCE